MGYPVGKNTDVLVAIPVYNERASIPELLSRLDASGIRESADVLFIDDGSVDDTATLVRNSNYTVVSHCINLGQGFSCNTAMLMAVAFDYDVLVTMDGDGQHEPAEIPSFITAIRQSDADVVVGSRISGLSYQNEPLLRQQLLPLVNWVLCSVTGYHLTDTMCGFRAYRVDSLRRILPILKRILENEYTAAELFVRFSNAGFEIKEIPVHLNARIAGNSHKGTLKYGFGIIRALFRSLLTR